MAQKNSDASWAVVIGQSKYSAKLSEFVSSYTEEFIVILLVIKNALYTILVIILPLLLTEKRTSCHSEFLSW